MNNRFINWAESTFAIIAVIFISIVLVALSSTFLSGGWFILVCIIIAATAIGAVIAIENLRSQYEIQQRQTADMTDMTTEKATVEEENSPQQEETLSCGIEQYLIDNGYRYEIEEQDELKWHKQELNIVFEEAASTVRLKQELVRNIAHEIKTPLTNLQLVAEGLEDGIFTIDDGRSIKQIIDSVNRMNTTVKMMSEYVSNGVGGLEGETSDLALCLVAAYQKALDAAKRSGSGVSVSIKKSEHFASMPVMVKMSSQRLEEVLSSIVSNAFEHAHGMSTLVLSLEDEVHPLSKQMMAKVSITDDGCGAPSEYAYKMCEPFWKADESHTFTVSDNKTASPGLGLSVVKEIIMSNGGHLDISCAEGAGTCVSIWLPMSA